MLAGRTILNTDAEGNRYYTAEEARKELGVSRATFDKRIAEAKIRRYRRANDIRFYYRVEDIQAIKRPPDEFFPVEEDEDRPALAFA